MRILITGATSGIGEQLVQCYSQAGHQVTACGRNPQKLEQLVQQLPSIETLCFDLTRYDDYPATVANGEPLDLLILNAGDCAYIDNPLQFDAQLFERLIHINLISIGYALQWWLKEIKAGGRVVFMSSSAELLPLPRAEAYGTSKAALSYLARTLTVTLKQHNIHVTLVHPGFVKTPLTDRNNFPMPMMITSKRAATHIIKGIERGKAEVNFPTIFIGIMKFLRLLPSPLWQRIATRMTLQ